MLVAKPAKLFVLHRFWMRKGDRRKDQKELDTEFLWGVIAFLSIYLVAFFRFLLQFSSEERVAVTISVNRNNGVSRL